MVGLVPQLPGGDPVAVAAHHEGQRLAVLGGVGRGVALHAAVPPGALAALLEPGRGGGGPARRLPEGEQHLDVALLGLGDHVVDLLEVPGVPAAVAVLLEAGPAQVDPDHADPGLLGAVEHALAVGGVVVAPEQMGLHGRRLAGRGRSGGGPGEGAEQAGRRDQKDELAAHTAEVVKEGHQRNPFRLRSWASCPGYGLSLGPGGQGHHRYGKALDVCPRAAARSGPGSGRL